MQHTIIKKKMEGIVNALKEMGVPYEIETNEDESYFMFTEELDFFRLFLLENSKVFLFVETFSSPCLIAQVTRDLICSGVYLDQIHYFDAREDTLGHDIENEEMRDFIFSKGLEGYFDEIDENATFH